MTRIFAVGFPREMTEAAIKALFDEFGDVAKLKLITDQDTGFSKGYAFIDFSDEVGARLAIKELDGSQFEGRTLNVRVADNQPMIPALPIAQPRVAGKRPRIKRSDF